MEIESLQIPRHMKHGSQGCSRGPHIQQGTGAGLLMHASRVTVLHGGAGGAGAAGAVLGGPAVRAHHQLLGALRASARGPLPSVLAWDSIS